MTRRVRLPGAAGCKSHRGPRSRSWWANFYRNGSDHTKAGSRADASAGRCPGKGTAVFASPAMGVELLQGVRRKAVAVRRLVDRRPVGWRSGSLSMYLPGRAAVRNIGPTGFRRSDTGSARNTVADSPAEHIAAVHIAVGLPVSASIGTENIAVAGTVALRQVRRAAEHIEPKR